MLLLSAVGAGAVIAMLLTTLLIVSGVGLRSAAAYFTDLPKSIAEAPLPQRSQIVASDGTPIAELYEEYRIVVDMEAIAPVMSQAIIAIEDSRFYEHSGIDPVGTSRAFFANIRGGAIQGGSTITQQYVKNILLGTADSDEERAAAKEKTLMRKIREARYAIGLEKELSKEKILHGYLTISYFGSGAYGVEAAARRYFNISASELTLPQAAMLAGIVRSPWLYDPNIRPEVTRDRRNLVLQRMFDLGMISREALNQAREAPLDITMTPIPNGCAGSIAPYFCDYVRRTLRDDPALGETRSERLSAMSRAGLTIKTTLDLEKQKSVQQTVRRAIPVKDPSRIGIALTMVEPGTGNVLAMGQNRVWGTETAQGETQINYNADGEKGSSTGFQAGSTFKAFVLAAAMNQNISPYRQLSAPEEKTFTNFRECDANDRPRGAKFPPYTVRNSTGSGTFNLLQGTWLSVNTFFVGLEEITGICEPARLAEEMGIRNGDGSPVERVPSFTLGVAPISPLALANAYATFAARGMYCPATVITEIQALDGSTIPWEKEKCRRVMPQRTADAVTQILAGVIDGPDSRRTGAAMSLGRPAAGKTGTTNGNRATWFVGYTPQLAAAVWVGDPRGRKALERIRINGVSYSRVFGGSIAGPAWRRAMLAASEGLPARGFPRPGIRSSASSPSTQRSTPRSTPTRRAPAPSPQTSAPSTPPPTTSEPSPDPVPTTEVPTTQTQTQSPTPTLTTRTQTEAPQTVPESPPDD
jgi:membrane peptidoglycan carboxypeptidase